MKKTVLASTVAILLVLGGTGAAHAETEPSSPPPADDSVSTSRCAVGATSYLASTSASGFTQAVGPGSSVTGGPGVTLSISKSVTFSVTGTISATADVSAGAARGPIEAKIGGSIEGSVSGTFSGTTTNSGTWTVPTSWQIGRLAIGAVKYQGEVQKYVMAQACNIKKVGSPAKFNVPRAEWSFRTTRVQ